MRSHREVAREVIFELPTFATYGNGIDLWGPICARLKVCNITASASSNVCVYVRVRARAYVERFD